jgi:hypothetical protein
MGRTHLQFIETNLVRWIHLDLSIQSHTRIDSLLAALMDAGRQAAAAFNGPTVARCTLRGNGPLHRDLQREDASDELREQLQSVLMVESVRIATGPELDFESIENSETLVSDFLKLADRALEDPAVRQRLADSLIPLFRRREMPPLDDARIREWIERAAAMGVDLLLD